MRYADDILLGFQYRAEADRLLEMIRERLGKFGLELHPDKTRRIEFGQYAERNRKLRGEGKPESFEFLGFSHISGKNQNGWYTVRRTYRHRQGLWAQFLKPLLQSGILCRGLLQVGIACRKGRPTRRNRS